jgi:hypothetical protein
MAQRDFPRLQAHLSEAVGPSRESTSTGVFSNEEIQNLRRLLSQLESPPTTTVASSFCNSGNTFLANFGTCSWIIDSGANRHMTGSSKHFLSYSPCHNKETVRLADGSFRSVAGTGSIACTSNFQLSSVLHIPSFRVNILSVNYLTKTLNCKVEFFPTHCVIQDLTTGRVIGSGR